MNHSSTPPWLFILDGTFLGFPESSSPRTTRYLTLDVDEEPMTIELSKTLSRSLSTCLRPGDRIRCIGRSQLDLTSKSLRLSAYQVLTLSHPMSA